MKKILKPIFFARTSLKVAEELIGKFIIREIKGKRYEYIITETESYGGIEDLASHASRGRTKRTEVMFGKAGVLYIYLIYGMYYMLNVVTEKNNSPGAVLIRSVNKINGPGRLTKALLITKELNNLNADKNSGLWFEDRGIIISKKDIKTGPRIGVEYAGDKWSKKPWRFIYNKKETPN